MNSIKEEVKQLGVQHDSSNLKVESLPNDFSSDFVNPHSPNVDLTQIPDSPEHQKNKFKTTSSSILRSSRHSSRESSLDHYPASTSALNISRFHNNEPSESHTLLLHPVAPSSMISNRQPSSQVVNT